MIPQKTLHVRYFPFFVGVTNRIKTTSLANYIDAFLCFTRCKIKESTTKDNTREQLQKKNKRAKEREIMCVALFDVTGGGGGISGFFNC